MRYKLEKIGCYILIIVLLPYIVTVFMNGTQMVSLENVEESKIKVSVNNEESDAGNNYMKMSIEDYGIGILAREIPVSYEPEAMKAQAVIIRTRIYKQIEEKGSDLVFSEEFWTEADMQKGWGVTKFTGYYNKLKNAWKNTEGQVLIYDGKLIYTPFFYLSNGNTRDGEEALGKKYPYLKIRECPLDIEAVEQLQTSILDREVFGQKDQTNKTQIPIKVILNDTAGYVLKVQVGKETMSGEEFRQKYNLTSSCFSIQEYEGKIRITTRGVGHGIGLSQNTANKMAEEGMSAKEILQYFYEGCEINEVVDFVRKTNSMPGKEIDQSVKR